MDFFFNYGPKDFKDKEPKEIIKMKPGKVSVDFLEINKDDEIFKALSPAAIKAIQMLIDSKDNMKIYEKCYNKNGIAPPPEKKEQPEKKEVPDKKEVQMPMQIPMQMQMPIPMPMPMPMPIHLNKSSSPLKKGSSNRPLSHRMSPLKAPAPVPVAPVPVPVAPVLETQKGGKRRSKKSKKGKRSKKSKKGKRTRKTRKNKRKSRKQ